MKPIKIESRKLFTLEFAEYNPRTISKKQFKDLKKSITEFGIVAPIVVNINKDRGSQKLRTLCSRITLSQPPLLWPSAI